MKSRLLLGLGFMVGLVLAGCRTAPRVEALDLASEARFFWHPQGDQVEIGLGVRETARNQAELTLAVRNRGALPAALPKPGPGTVTFYVDGQALPAGEAAAAAEAMALAPGETRQYSRSHTFKPGRLSRLFARLAPAAGEVRPAPMVTPEIRVSTLYGAPARLHFEGWSDVAP